MIYFLCLLPVAAFAEGIVDSYTSFLSLTQGLMSSVCFLSGGAMLAASLAQFKLHRDNPSEVKLKVPVTLLVLGAILLGLSYLPSPF